MRNICALLISFASLMTGLVQAQVSAPAANPSAADADRRTATATTQPAASPDLGTTLPQLQQVVENARVDLAKLRIEKWKADANYKRQAQSDAESLQRNMTQALPTLVAQVHANPGSLAAIFKLYRNVNALYDVMASLAESAGAFGPKEDYQALSTDTSNLDAIRRTFADKVEMMAAARDSEIIRLHAQVRQAQAATATPAKKTIVDDTEPAKPAAKKKKPVPKPPSTPQQ